MSLKKIIFYLQICYITSLHKKDNSVFLISPFMLGGVINFTSTFV